MIERTRFLFGAGAVLLLFGVAAGCGGTGAGVQTTTVDAEEAHARATQHVREGDHERAIEVLFDALDEHPDDARLHSRLGYILRYAGLFNASRAAYERAMEIDPTPRMRLGAEGQIAKGLVYMGRYEEALELQRGLDRHLAALGREADEKMDFYEGIMSFYAGDHDAAVRLFDRAEAKDPESVWTEFGRAYRDAIRGDTASLRSRARALRGPEVADGERHYRLVHFHSLAGDPDEAVGRLEAAFDGGFFAYPYIREDPLLAEEVRVHPRFPAVLDGIRERHEGFAARMAGR